MVGKGEGKNRKKIERMLFFVGILFLFPFVAVLSKDDIFSSYRKDAYSTVIMEPEPHPEEGGRVQIIGSSKLEKVSLPIKSVKINGIEGLNLDLTTFTYYDWLKVKYEGSTNQLMISFHSRNTDWLKFNTSSILSVEVIDSNDNQVLFGDVTADPSINFRNTYITTINEGQTVICHLHNYDQNIPWSIVGIEFDGKPLSISDIETTTSQSNYLTDFPTLYPNEHFIFSFKLSNKKSIGDLWTMIIFEKTDSRTVSNGGRIVKEKAPFTAWIPNECPFPKLNNTHYNIFKDSRIDTSLISPNGFQRACSTNFYDYINNVLPEYPDINFFLMDPGDNWTSIENWDAITACHIYDEPDLKKDYLSKLRMVLRKTLIVEENYPMVPTYLNGCMNSRSGMFSGITDFYSCDFYIGACAPCALPIIDGVIEQYWSFRMNQMPNPYLFYTQMYCDCWYYQAYATEINIQIIQAIMAGSKGLMIFEARWEMFPKDFNSTIGGVLRSVSLIREDLRRGDIESMEIFSNDTKKSRVQVIRTQDKIIVLFVTKNADTYSGAACLFKMDKHWKFYDWIVKEVFMRSSQVQDVYDVKEIVNGNFVEVEQQAVIEFESGELRFGNIVLPKENPFRIFYMSYK